MKEVFARALVVWVVLRRASSSVGGKIEGVGVGVGEVCVDVVEALGVGVGEVAGDDIVVV